MHLDSDEVLLDFPRIFYFICRMSSDDTCPSRSSLAIHCRCLEGLVGQASWHRLLSVVSLVSRSVVQFVPLSCHRRFVGRIFSSLDCGRRFYPRAASGPPFCPLACVQHQRCFEISPRGQRLLGQLTSVNLPSFFLLHLLHCRVLLNGRFEFSMPPSFTHCCA